MKVDSNKITGQFTVLKKHVSIFLVCLGIFVSNEVQAQTQADFQFGSASYFNINIGESVHYQETEIKLLQIKNHFNQFIIGGDTVWFKVSRRTLPLVVNGIRVFVADNKNVKALTDDAAVHDLLKKDVLICLSNYQENMLNPNKYSFPISYNDGFLWKAEENSHMFSYERKPNGKNYSHSGLKFDLHDARGIEKHWLVAIENTTVVWVEEKNSNQSKQETCVLLESNSQPGIYYVYDHLYSKNLIVGKGDKLKPGELISTAWGDETWGQLHFSVIKSDTIPNFDSKFYNTVNCFFPLYELYFNKSYNLTRNYSKGKISFGLPSDKNGDKKNVLAFEDYSGKGWNLGNWNTADKVEFVSNSFKGNARLKKKIFQNEKAFCTNPKNYYDFEINVRNGVYRIRANVGDLKQPSWQKIEFEKITAATYSLNSGEYKWTPEKIVRVNDTKLTVRIYVDENNRKPAGISEIVFQKAE